jgi:hypothetical protein
LRVRTSAVDREESCFVGSVHLHRDQPAQARKTRRREGRVPGLVEFVEANEPQLLAFNEYADDEGTEAAVVAERAAAAYREGWLPRD